jgi:hypothetical protein
VIILAVVLVPWFGFWVDTYGAIRFKLGAW